MVELNREYFRMKNAQSLKCQSTKNGKTITKDIELKIRCEYYILETYRVHTLYSHTPSMIFDFTRVKYHQMSRSPIRLPICSR